jgi:hypothetical protein
MPSLDKEPEKEIEPVQIQMQEAIEEEKQIEVVIEDK